MTETIDRAAYEALMLSGERCAQAREDAQAVRSGDREAAKAIAAHIAPWVYCPPFSLTPGTYPFM